MPQETNLNVSPYFDDFDADKDYYKVLFKPGYPIQARELNTLQSIAQYQTEQFGKHIFKEGSVVIPGQLRYENPLYAVEVESSFNGIPVSLYFDNLLGTKIRGSVSGVTAEIVYLLKSEESERGNNTIYVKYIQSGGTDFDLKTFSNGETLLLDTPISFGNSTIQAGQGFCNILTENGVSEGSSVSVADGVYFVRGIFAKVRAQTILLDQYGITPSYKVGFDVVESIVNSDEDPSLVDNAQGFSNYAAPGADRFKLELILAKKDINDNETDSFVEILRVQNGIPQFFDKNPQYNILREQLARRTYDESGDYFVKPFTLFVRDSLNDRTLSDGMFFENQRTAQGNTPSEDLMVYEIGPGKAYVSGYDVETIAATLIDVPKARTTKKAETQAVSYNAGSLTIVNNVYGSVTPGLGTDSVVSLMNSRIGNTPHVASGTTIGYARVYDFVPETSYVDDTSRFELSLFDIQTYTTIGLTTSFSYTLTTPAFIEGKRSNASGYLVSNTPSGTTSLTLYQVSGKFLENEPISINGIDDSRLINSVTDYTIRDIKSIYSQSGISTFNADVLLSRRSYIASPGTTFNITQSSGGISTVSAGLQRNFSNLIKVGDIISYSSATSDPIYNKVTLVSAGGTYFEIQGITTVTGVCNGALPNTTQNITNVVKIQSNISNTQSLLTGLGHKNIVSLDFAENEVIQRRAFTGTFSGNTITVSIPAEDIDIFFESFDEDRYVLSYPDGTYEPLRSDQFLLSTTGKSVTLSNLSKSSGNYELISTVKNTKANSKSKKFNKTSSILISNSKLTSSGIGTTTLNDGLTYSKIYGTRVQDKEISLGVPDVARFLAIFESEDISDPVLPNLTLSGFTGPTNSNADFVVGEWIKGQSSGATAIVINKKDSDKLEYVSLNTFNFSIGEVIVGKESSIQAIVSSKLRGSKNIFSNYSLDDGQRSTYYDYSRIVRKKNVAEPKGKLRVIFQNYTIDPSDTGEFITANSYNQENFKHDVSYYANARLTDYIDIRPRVGVFSSSTRSPFEFNSRNFAVDGQYSEYILAPRENITLNYTYYVGRIDKVVLRPDGLFEVIQGQPDDVPYVPNNKTNTLDIATVYVSPYTYNVKNVAVDMSVHKRYRMSDISKLEDRIQRLEKYTTLSLLETKTENLTIKDAETGLDRFKCGFFVDNFANNEYQDISNPSFRSAIDTSKGALRPKHHTTSIDLQLGSEAISGIGQTFNPNIDKSYVTDLGSPGVRKTGDLITLDYNEVLYYEQPYATKTESVTPFLVRYWQGLITLNPPIDSWIEEEFRTVNNLVQNEATLVLPDENVTVVNDVVVDERISQDEANAQFGIDGTLWIDTVKNILADVTTIGGVPVRLNNNDIQRYESRAGETGFVSGTNILRLEVNYGQVSAQDRNIISRILPPDAAASFFNRLDNFPAFAGFVVVELDLSTGTSGTVNVIDNIEETTETTQSTIILPPEVLVDENISESISHYTEPVRFVRSRNIEFDIKGLRPVTRFYPFFEGIDVSNYIVPKLLEIEMISGKFQIGETVSSSAFDTETKISFRVCKPNHKTGPFDGSNPPSITNPVPIVDFTTGQVLPQDPNLTPKPDIFKLNPYTQQVIEDDYTESSTFINVDTKALQLPSETEFFGLVRPEMTLIGSSSGAVARIRRVRLVSDSAGRLLGSLFIPNPKVIGNPKWTNGQNTFTVIDTPDLNNLDEIFDEFIANSRVNESSAEAEYSSSGIINVEELTITTTRDITFIPQRVRNVTTITNTTTLTSDVQVVPGGGAKWEQWDPLAQSFYVREDSGIFLTSCDIFFETKDDSIPVTFQIRPMIAGVPSTLVVPFSEVTLEPDQVNVSTDGTIPTRIRFPSPVYLNGPKEIQTRQAPIGTQQGSEYAMVLLSGSPNYRVFCSELGQNDIYTGIKVSQQYTLGSMFKSQNGSTWSPAQLEDLRYKIYRADFTNEGLVRFFNPDLALSNRKVTVTGANQLLPLSRKVVVGLGSTGFDSVNVVPGVSLVQGSATGTLVSLGGSIAVGAGASVVNVGTGYSTGTYTGVTLQSETGIGVGAVATLIVDGNEKISTITITNGGNNYSFGDVLKIPEDSSLNSGFGALFQVTSIGSTNTFVIDNVQGAFSAGITTISYVNSSGITTYVGAGVTISSVNVDQYNTGLHMKIYQPNHGMHSSENYVEISKMRPTFDGVFADTTAELAQGGTLVNLDDATGFATFEGVAVSASNPGYALIGYEIFEYTTVSGNTLTISQRGVDGSQVSQLTYPVGSPVEKYEFNGISLRRINKVHNLSLVDQTTHPTELNSYHIKIETGSTDFEGTGIGSDRTNDLYFRETVQKGRTGTNITNNVQFEAITPNFASIVPSGTTLTPRMRTFTGTSVGGNENSFVDSGFEAIQIGEINYLSTPRVVCSRVNEERHITNTPGSKSLTMEFLMQTENSLVSPVIDTIKTSVILTSNLVNNPNGIGEASTYATADNTRSLLEDDHAAIYISRPVRLKIPANSLKVLLSASRNTENDIRVLYRLFRNDAPEVSQNFELFPGYSNYTVDGEGIRRVIDESLNDGSPDKKVQQTSDRSFKDYEYTADNLPEFDAFSIKIVMASSNQATPPLVKQLRAIATIRPTL